jgi:CRISPR-associated protein Cas2
MHKLLQNYGISVQYSVFECDLEPAQVEEAKLQAQGVMNPQEDSLLIYPVCRECRNKVQISGQGDIWVDSEWWVY